MEVSFFYFKLSYFSCTCTCCQAHLISFWKSLDISVHEALIFQAETKQGHHTADSGNFIRNFPGRLILYPAVASTCSVIFFAGDWTDFYVAGIAGFVSGLVDYALTSIKAGIFVDVSVGISVGIVGGLFYRFGGEDICISAVFLGSREYFVVLLAVACTFWRLWN
jgi:uncharacterized membrane protein YjjP (DUF1212 family)